MNDASQNVSPPRDAVARRSLMRRLGLSDRTLPAGGNWYPEDNTLEAVLDLIEARLPARVLVLGGGLSVAILARALKGIGELWMVEHDPQVVEVTQNMLQAVEDHAQIHVVEAELQEYDKHNLWYDRHVLGGIPSGIELMFIDGPPHFCGRTPRYPAGPELFRRLSPTGQVVLDKGKRVKEKKALLRWAEEFPHLSQSRLKRGGGAMVLAAD